MHIMCQSVKQLFTHLFQVKSNVVLTTPFLPTPSAVFAHAQVPGAVSSLCVQAYKQHVLSVALRSAISTLAAFLEVVSLSGMISHNTQLGAAVLKQVQRSGLMQLLAAMMADATAVLQDHPAASPAAAFTPEQYILSAHASNVLVVSAALVQLLPRTPLSFDGCLAGITAAAAGLATASLQHLSATMKQQRQTDSGWDQATEALCVTHNCAAFSAISAVVMCLKTAGGVGVLLQQLQMEQQLLIPELLSSLTAVIVVVALHLTVQNGASSSSSSSSIQAGCSSRSSSQCGR
jgi:hypothetical protein